MEYIKDSGYNIISKKLLKNWKKISTMTTALLLFGIGQYLANMDKYTLTSFCVFVFLALIPLVIYRNLKNKKEGWGLTILSFIEIPFLSISISTAVIGGLLGNNTLITMSSSVIFTIIANNIIKGFIEYKFKPDIGNLDCRTWTSIELGDAYRHRRVDLIDANTYDSLNRKEDINKKIHSIYSLVESEQ